MGFAANTHSVRGVGWADERGKRDEMEDGWVFVDAFGNNPKSAFFAVYDGHGGRDAVDAASTVLHEYLWAELEAKVSPDMNENQWVSDSIVRAFGKTDDHIIEKQFTGGAVACVCLLWEDTIGEGCPPTRRVYTAHCGDARAVISRDKQGVRLTSQSDHKATDAGEQANVVANGGAILNDRVNGMLAITRALGDPQLKKPKLRENVVSNIPDVTATPITEIDDFLIIACDGLWDVIGDQDAVNFVYHAMAELQEEGILESDQPLAAALIAKALVIHSLNKGTSDNVTCMVVIL